MTYQAEVSKVTINTLKSYVTGFSYYFRLKEMPNLVLSNEFKKFKRGLQRSYKERSSPFAKVPFKPEYFIRFLELNDMKIIENVKMMFYMTLSFFVFLRVSELLNLKKKDIVYDSQTNKLILTIRFSKTDQEGKGFTTYIYNNNNKINFVF